MQEFVTPKQVARAIGVSESSLKRWCDKGLLSIARTAGGHRRLPIADVLKFIRAGNHTLVEPEMLGLPATIGQGAGTIVRAQTRLIEALVQGQELLVRQILIDLYLAGHSIAEIGDHLISPTFQKLGQLWECGDVQVYEERRACQITLHALQELRSLLVAPLPAAPVALGATLAGDIYQLPVLMVEMTLREVGWKAQCYGSNLPVETLVTAVETDRPRLCWLSVSYYANEQFVIDATERLYSVCSSQGTALLVGGRMIGPDLRTKLAYTVHCELLRDVAAFARQIYPAGAPQNQHQAPDHEISD